MPHSKKGNKSRNAVADEGPDGAVAMLDEEEALEVATGEPIGNAALAAIGSLRSELHKCQERHL